MEGEEKATPQMSVSGRSAQAYAKNNDVQGFAGFQEAARKEKQRHERVSWGLLFAQESLKFCL